MVSKLETIVVPTAGNFKQDIQRWNAAVAIGEQMEKEGKEVRYIISGIGPEINKALNADGRRWNKYFAPIKNYVQMDIHPDLWNTAMEYAKSHQKKGKPSVIGLDIRSTNSIQNLVNTFPKGTEGSYVIVSRKWHNARFRMIEEWARGREYFSDKLKISYVNTTGYSFKEMIYDAVSFVKTFLFGRKELTRAIQATEA
jgi:hypothetical protein